MTEPKYPASMIPVDEFRAARIDTTMNGFGILLDARLGPVLIDGDGSSCMAIPLTGDMEFRHFQLRPGSPLRGLFFEGIKFLIDPNSQFHTHHLSCRGALTFENEKLCMITSPQSDSFDDDISFHLPFAAGSNDGVPVGFSKWSVGKIIEDSYHELWAFEREPKKL